MSLPVQITDHVAQALSKLVTPFKNRPLFSAWCASHVVGWQDIEDSIWAFLAAFDVDTADLPRLTILGKLVGQTPIGALATFRRLVKVRIAVNRSDTTAPTLIRIARLLLDGDVWYTDGHCAIMIEARSPLPADVDPFVLVSFLRLAKLGGVQLNLLAQNEDDALLMGDDNADAETDEHNGLSNDVGGTGGHIAGDY